MTAVAVRISNVTNSRLLPRRVTSDAPLFFHCLGQLDVSALCTPPRMVNECRREEDISNRLPFMEKAVMWFGSAHYFWISFGNNCIALAESKSEWQDIMMVAEVRVNVSGLLRTGQRVSVTSSL